MSPWKKSSALTAPKIFLTFIRSAIIIYYMNKLFCLLLVFSLHAFSAEEEKGIPLLRTEAAPEREFTPNKSHWLMTFGFEGLKYDVPFEFTGERRMILPGERELWGGRLGLGGEIFLGAGFITTTRVEGYFLGTLFARRENAGPEDSDEEVGFSKNSGQVYGIDITQSLGYMFSFKTKNPFMDEWTSLTVQPYIEAGVGRGWAYNRVNYQYDTGPAAGPSQVQEDYRSTMSDELVNARFGAGINLISNQGFFFYMKAFVNNFTISKRKIETVSRPDDGSFTSNTSTLNNVTIDPITTYALGGGYKF